MRIGKMIQSHLDRIWEQKFSDAKVEQLQKIYVGKSRIHIIREYRRKLERSILALLLILVCLLVPVMLLSGGGKRMDGQNRIRRQRPEGNVDMVELEAELAGDRQTVTVEVAPRSYTAEELEAKFTQAKQYIRETYLGENLSSDHIVSDLQLMVEIPNSAIAVEWQMDSGQLVETDGSVHWDRIDQEIGIEIVAILSYGEDEERLPLAMTICPPQRSMQEKMWREWEESQEILAAKTTTEEYMQLPQAIDGKPVHYQTVQRPVWRYLFLAGGIGILLLPLILESWMRQKISRREKELVMDYPELVEQYVLLIGAGMTIKGAWLRIATEYLSMRQKGNQKYRFLYEEMLVTMRELENGMSEARAYEAFGKRIGILSYIKFSTLLMQNLRKGSNDLLRILEYEAADAFRERKEHARTLGEEAGTKLLMPMMLMLLVVLIMIIYAAFRSM